MLHELSIDGFRSTPHGPADYVSIDGKVVVEVKEKTSGTRGLYHGAMGLAIHLERAPGLAKAFLILHGSRMSLARIVEEWKDIQSVIRAGVASRLALIALGTSEDFIEPDEPLARRLAGRFRAALTGARPSTLVSSGDKQMELEKALLVRWLVHQGPIAIGALCALIGCSYPTAKRALISPSMRQHVGQTSNRSVELRSFPHEIWRKLSALAPSRRGTVKYRDQSGDRPSPSSLLRRLERSPPPNVAVGGVLAARQWHRDFDLNGTPRLDLVLHAPDGRVDAQFMRKLDPALVPTDDPGESAVVAIHPLIRTESLFAPAGEGKLPWADPVETALDLYELTLNAQANRMLTHLRPEVRLE